jgi:WhiB family transcriptional regulator, redox-sensing transcriptional regulator
MNASWSSRAACRGLDPRLFFPADDEDAGPATAICAECPVREPCLEFALGSREREGVWGGTTERERRRILRRRRRAS